MLAAECRAWRHFISHEGYLGDMLLGLDLEYKYYDPLPYACPGCDALFPRLSGLFQHVESSSCDQSLNDGAIGTLKRFLRGRLA
jgi:hypothetical protein